MTGLSLTGHPMTHARAILEPNGVRTVRQLIDEGRDGETIAVAGLVICRQRPPTAKGFMFLTLEDETGLINVTVTPKHFAVDGPMISAEPILLVRGVLQRYEGTVNVRARRIRALQLGC